MTLGTPEIYLVYHKRKIFFKLIVKKERRAFNFFLKGIDFKFMPVDVNNYFTGYMFLCIYNNPN